MVWIWSADADACYSAGVLNRVRTRIANSGLDDFSMLFVALAVRAALVAAHDWLRRRHRWGVASDVLDGEFGKR